MPATARKRSRKTRPSLADQMLDNEITSLRQQVGRELTRAMSSGISLSLGDITEEYVTELKTLRSRIAIYDRMANDPNIAGQLRAIWMTIVSGVRWKMVGGREELRVKCAANFLRQGPRKYWCARSWNETLYNSLSMLPYGFSLFGKTWTPADDGTMVLSDLTWLHPRSVDEDGWDMDDADNLLGVRRSYQTGTGKSYVREYNGADDLFLMTWGRRGANWEGVSYIRSMYRPWKLGEMAEKIDIIDLQNRGVGIPVAYLSGQGGQKERDTLVDILKSLRGGSKERAYIVLQADEKVEFLTSTGTARSAQDTLAHHRASLVKAGGQEYFEQGNTATGSRAGASALATGFFVNVDGIIRCIEDQFNNGCGRMPGIIEEWCAFNDDDLEAEEIPTLQGSRVSPTEQLDNIPLVQDAIAKGAIPATLSIANEMLRRLGWPEQTPAEFEEAMSRKVTSPAFGGPGRPNEAGPDEQGRDDKDGRRLNMQEKKTANSGVSLVPRSAVYPWQRSIAR
jgi:hypothetical protein